MTHDQVIAAEAGGMPAWFELPAVPGESPDDPPRPPFECEGGASFVYRGSLVYARFSDPRDEREAEKVARSRRLTAKEVHELDAEMPFPFLDWLSAEAGDSVPQPEPAYVGVGDVVSWVSRKLGFTECEGCRRRKGWLNSIPLWPRRRIQPPPA